MKLERVSFSIPNLSANVLSGPVKPNANKAKSHGQDFLDPVSTKYAKAAHKYHTGPIAKKARENPNQYAKMQARMQRQPKRPTNTS